MKFLCIGVAMSRSIFIQIVIFFYNFLSNGMNFRNSEAVIKHNWHDQSSWNCICFALFKCMLFSLYTLQFGCYQNEWGHLIFHLFVNFFPQFNLHFNRLYKLFSHYTFKSSNCHLVKAGKELLILTKKSKLLTFHVRLWL